MTGAGNGTSSQGATGADVVHDVEPDNRGNGGSVVTAGGGSGRGVEIVPIQPIPSSIVQAICMIMTTVDSVKKTSRNAHGGYNFASTDDIYAAVTRKMGEVGLVLMALEDEAEVKRLENKKGETVQWLRCVFSYVLATTKDTWSDPRAKRTLYIQITGPQTFQAAQSYAEKAYLRSLFKLPTGDMDLDSMPQADNEDDQVALNGGRKRKSSAEGKRDGSVKTFNQIRADISTAINTEMLQWVRQTWADDWATMPERWHATLEEDYDVKMQELNAAQAAE